MTAEQLTGLLDANLEEDSRYKGVISAFRDRVLEPGVRLDELLGFLDGQIPARFQVVAQKPAATPTSAKILFVEAVARKLGRDWADDCASFVDVSIASARLQEVAQALTFEASRRHIGVRAPFAVIILPRGERHSLMSHLTGALFQTLGWQQQVLPQEALRQRTIAAKVACADVICIGWSNMRLKSHVRQLIADIRLISRGRNQPIIAGGAAALDFVDFLVEMGIDCICDSAYSAVKISESFYDLEKINPVAMPEAGGTDKRTHRIDRQSR